MVRPGASFVERHTADVDLPSGRRIRVRPIVPEDKADLADGVRRLSPESRYRRFFSAIAELPETSLAYFTELDYANHFAWVAVDLARPGQPGIGVARYVRLQDEPDAAEVAVAVADEHQGHGIGTLLLQAVAVTAREHGIGRLVANVLADNRGGQALLRGLGATFRRDATAGIVVADLPVPDSSTDFRDTALYDALRAAARGEVYPPPATPPVAES